MKNNLSLLGLLGFVFLMSCGNAETEISTDVVNNPNTASETIASDKMPEIKFEQELFEFGKIPQGEQVTYEFKFTNTGNADLLISNAQGSCGCTVPEWPKQPIAPGAQGVIKVVFDSDGKVGRQHKKISIIANTVPSTNVVAISGEVIAPEPQS